MKNGKILIEDYQVTTLKCKKPRCPVCNRTIKPDEAAVILEKATENKMRLHPECAKLFGRSIIEFCDRFSSE